MNLVADEGVERIVVQRLRDEGHDVSYVAELDPGLSDDEVLQMAERLEAVLVTNDKDFGELVFRQGRAQKGVLLLRLVGLSPERKASIVADTVSRFGDEVQGTFAVVTPGHVRIRAAG